MDKRMVDFIRALRAAGVRISLAESQDAMYGVDAIGISNREQFNSTLKTTLIKESRDQPIFDYFFPLFFASGQPPMENIPDNLSGEDQETLKQALQSLMGNMDALKDLLRQLMEGQPFSQEQLDQMGEQSGLMDGNNMYQRQWFERRMEQQAGLRDMEDLIEQLMQALERQSQSKDRIFLGELLIKDGTVQRNTVLKLLEIQAFLSLKIFLKWQHILFEFSPDEAKKEDNVSISFQGIEPFEILQKIEGGDPKK